MLGVGASECAKRSYYIWMGFYGVDSKGLLGMICVLLAVGRSVTQQELDMNSFSTWN